MELGLLLKLKAINIKTSSSQMGFKIQKEALKHWLKLDDQRDPKKSMRVEFEWLDCFQSLNPKVLL